MNILSGLIFGLLENAYLNIFIYSFIWGLFHCFYGYIFNFHKNLLVMSTKGGNPVKSYFIARFLTSIITTFISASIVLLIRRLFDIQSLNFGFVIPKINISKFLLENEYLYFVGFFIVLFVILDEWVIKNFENYVDFKSTINKIWKTKGAIKQILKETFNHKS